MAMNRGEGYPPIAGIAVIAEIAVIRKPKETYAADSRRKRKLELKRFKSRARKHARFDSD